MDLASASPESALPAAQHRILSSGDTALVVEFGDAVDRRTSERALALFERLSAASLPGVVELMPTFRSLMVHYDPVRTSRKALVKELAPHLRGLGAAKAAARTWEIPVCYERSFGLDVEHVATAAGLSPEAVVARHSGETYHVYMIGAALLDPDKGESRAVIGATLSTPILLSNAKALLAKPTEDALNAAADEAGFADDPYNRRLHAVALRRAIERLSA